MKRESSGLHERGAFASCANSPAEGTGTGQHLAKWFEALLKELPDKFGGATSFVRASGQGLWRSGGEVERDNIAVIEVMTEELDRDFRPALRGRLERELSGHRHSGATNDHFIAQPELSFS